MESFEKGIDNEELALLFKRRSIRNYLRYPLEERHLEWILQAAMAAPSAVNRQPWEFVITTKEETLEHLRNGLRYAQYPAPAAIVVCGNESRMLPDWGRDFWIQDCSAATQNILLAATALGLGSVWIGIFPIEDRLQLLRNIFLIPNHVIPFSVVYVGHPGEEKKARTQYDSARVHREEYHEENR